MQHHTIKSLLFSAWLHSVCHPTGRYRKPLAFFTVLALGAMLMAGCVSSRITTIVGGDYDAKKNVTEYYVLPFGQVSLPGKWEKCGYVKSGRQQFFMNQDSVKVAVAFGRTEYFEWNQDGKLKGMDFLSTFYKWESEYFKSNGYEAMIIETDTASQYIIYRIYSETANTYFLVGVKSNGNVSNLSINYTDKWTEEEKISFLKNLYKS